MVGNPKEIGILGQLGKGIQAAGAKTKKLGLLGLAKGELETEKLALSRAYAKLGEAVYEVWASFPGSAVVEGDQRFTDELDAIRSCHGRIADIEQRIETIREGQ